MMSNDVNRGQTRDRGRDQSRGMKPSPVLQGRRQYRGQR